MEVNEPFGSSHIRPSENTDVFVMMHNSTSVTVVKYNENSVLAVGLHGMRNYIKGSQQ